MFSDVVFLTQVEAVDLIGDEKAPKIPQPEEGATYDKIWKKKEVAKVSTLNWTLADIKLNHFF